MATPVEFFPLEGVHRCFFEGCEQKEGSFVQHKNGRSHPMHLSCALKMIHGKKPDELFCSTCRRPVDGEFLRALSKRDVAVLEPSSPAAVSSSSSAVDQDEEYALCLQRKFDAEDEKYRYDEELSEEVARSLTDPSELPDSGARRTPASGTGAERLVDPLETNFDGLIAEDFQARQQLKQRRRQAALPPFHVIAAAHGNQGMSCNELTKAVAGVVCLAFTVGMIVKAWQGV